MGGRVSEKLVFGDYSTGAQNDLRISTELAEKMVCQWGMSDKIGPVRFDRGEEHPFLGRKIATEKSFSERMAWNIDREIEKLVREGEESARKIVEGRRSLLDRLAEALLEDEVLEGERLKAIFEEEPEESENKAAESSKEKQEKDRKESADKED